MGSHFDSQSVPEGEQLCTNRATREESNHTGPDLRNQLLRPQISTTVFRKLKKFQINVWITNPISACTLWLTLLADIVPETAFADVCRHVLSAVDID